MSVTSENERFIRRAHQIAEEEGVEGWSACFNDDGIFTDESIGVTYRGPQGKIIRREEAMKGRPQD